MKFVATITCPYYGDVESFCNGNYFDDEEEFKRIHAQSGYSHYHLNVKKIKAVVTEDIPIRYNLTMKNGNTCFSLGWDDQGTSVGGLFVNVPKEVRDKAMEIAKKEYKRDDLFWVEEYVV